MGQKLTKAIERLHPRDERSPRHAAWKDNISKSMRAARLRRRKADGLLTLNEVSVKACIPLYSIRQMARTGELATLKTGNRRYVRREDFLRYFGGAK